MNVKALSWYRQNSDYTENSGKVNKLPIAYFDTQIVKGGRLRYQDTISTNETGIRCKIQNLKILISYESTK